jgi:uncharacterized membrane protein
MKRRLFSQQTLWVAIVIFFALWTFGAALEAVENPSDENVTSAVVKGLIVAAMIYTARREIREMDERDRGK